MASTSPLFRGGQSSQIKSRILDSVKQAMEPYGSSTLSVLLWNFDATEGLSPIDIAGHPDEFVTSIHVVFGKASVMVEKRIARKICENYHFDEGRISGLAHALKLAVSATTRM